MYSCCLLLVRRRRQAPSTECSASSPEGKRVKKDEAITLDEEGYLRFPGLGKEERCADDGVNFAAEGVLGDADHLH